MSFDNIVGLFFRCNLFTIINCSYLMKEKIINDRYVKELIEKFNDDEDNKDERKASLNIEI